MTDLAEALPILGHNMDATLGCAAAESGDNMKPHLRSDGDVGGRCHGEGGGLPNGKARRPVIQQLRWGNSTDALEVGKLAGAAARAEGREAFDIIVVSWWEGLFFLCVFFSSCRLVNVVTKGGGLGAAGAKEEDLSRRQECIERKKWSRVKLACHDYTNSSHRKVRRIR